MSRSTRKAKSVQKQLLVKTKEFVRDVIIANHIKNIEKCKRKKVFKINPFTHIYLASLFGGRNSKVSLAKALIFPRCLGTSISTSVGTNFQKYIVKLLRAESSGVFALDFNFTDKVDRKKKNCQLKLGPNTLNSPDVKQLNYELSKYRRKTAANFGEALPVAGVAYGTEKELSPNYNKLNELGIPVYVGQDFWHRVTGDRMFYKKLIRSFEAAAREMKVKRVLNTAIRRLSKEL
jgi:hypothetical protein